MNIFLKLLINGLIGVPGLWWSGTSLGFALATSIVVSVIAYALGDAVILPRTNNTFASMADFLLVFALFWLSCSVFAQPYRLAGLFLTSFALSVAEYFFHDYLQRHGVHHTKHPG